MYRLLMAVLVAAALPEAAAPQTSPPAVAAQEMIAKRSADLVAILNGGGDIPATFAPQFLAQVPAEQVKAISAQLVAQLGPATGIAATTPLGPSAATLKVAFAKGSATMNLAVVGNGRIIGLRITATELASVARLADLAQVADAVRALPGQTAFIVADPAEIGTPLAGVNPDEALAIGSTFKLAILAELVRQVDAGGRAWNDEVTLDGSELPAGGFNRLPTATKVTLRRLAEEMIKVSDNSATDVLLRTLGREQVEAMQTTLGWRGAAGNVPFLSTMELFKLKGVGKGALGRRYLALDTEGRRKLLAGEVAATPGSAIGALFAEGQPVMIDKLEWFASPADLGRAMGWFDARRGTPAGDEALRILALNPGPAAALAPRFAYVGYKGGSEPGVVSMTLLLRTAAGATRVVSATWNRPGGKVDELSLAALVARAAELVAD